MGYKMNNERGFTLVELIIGIAIISIVLAGVLGVLESSVKTNQYVTQQTINTQDSRNVLNSIVDEIRLANSISKPALGASDNILVYTVGSETRKIYVGTDTAANTVVIEKDGAINQRLALKNAQSMKFTRTGTAKSQNQIQIELTLKGDKNTGNSTTSITVSTLNLPTE